MEIKLFSMLIEAFSSITASVEFAPSITNFSFAMVDIDTLLKPAPVLL